MECIIFTGLQASGKSSFFLKNFYKTHLRLNLDMLKTRHREGIFLEACRQGKQRVVIDNTNPTPEERQKYIDFFKGHHFQIISYYFESNFEACLERNAKREGKESIPFQGVKATYNKLEKPKYTEGFDKMYKVKIRNNQALIEEIINEI